MVPGIAYSWCDLPLDLESLVVIITIIVYSNWLLQGNPGGYTSQSALVPHPARALRPVEINNVPGATTHVSNKAGMLKAAKAPKQKKH